MTEAHYAAIMVKGLGPTNNRGTRVKATSQAGSLTLAWDYSKNTDGNMIAAAEALAAKLDWIGPGQRLAGGVLPNGDYCFVITN